MIRRYTRGDYEGWKETNYGEMVRYKDHLEAMATLEARCKELEIKLAVVEANREVERGLLSGYVHSFRSHNTIVSYKDITAKEALSIPTTDEHLQALFKEWLGEPVAFNHHFIQDDDFMPEEVLSHRETVPAISGLKYANKTEPLYAPKKVSN